LFIFVWNKIELLDYQNVFIGIDKIMKIVLSLK